MNKVEKALNIGIRMFDMPQTVKVNCDQALTALESGELVVTYKERIDFVESTVSSAIKGLLPDIQNEEQRKLMEEAIEATSHLREYLCGVDLQRREEEASPCPVCGRPWDTSKHNACECGASLQRREEKR